MKNKSLEDVVILNVDTNTLESPFNDLNNLPSDVVSLRVFGGEHACFCLDSWIANSYLISTFYLKLKCWVCEKGVRGINIESIFNIFTFWQLRRC